MQTPVRSNVILTSTGTCTTQPERRCVTTALHPRD
jgi:hypothetical protein